MKTVLCGILKRNIPHQYIFTIQCVSMGSGGGVGVGAVNSKLNKAQPLTSQLHTREQNKDHQQLVINK